MKISLITGLLLLVTGSAKAAGFALPTEQSAAALGMAGAFVGQADDASAAWYNPAAILNLDGTHIAAGAAAVMPTMKHINADTVKETISPQVHLIPHLYGTRKLNDRMAVSLSANMPFGLATKWARTSETRGVATLSNLKILNVNPSFAYRFDNRLTGAIGVDYVHLNAELDKMIAGNQYRLTGEADGLGGNAAVYYAATDKINIGATYRSEVTLHITDGLSRYAGSRNKATTSLTLPAAAAVGVSYKATPKLTVNGDYNYTGWSSYDKLVIRLPTSVSTEIKDWKNVWAIRLGGQYALNDEWKLRAGYMYDKNPVPEKRFETRLPDADRNGYSVGVGHTMKDITVDVAYMYLKFKTREITVSQAGGDTLVSSLNGTYRAFSHVVGLTVGYTF